MPIAYAMSSDILNIALSSISMSVTFLIIWKRISMIAGPEQKADARNLGASIEAFQKGLAARPL